jgi:17beta-estradiol 17-dehydrogenase / 3alpha(17beta)-hydroxysteroid dehydrogenase (NAD+) / 3-oxoacyl-[acyl-carrier protein] reductase alpha subunit
MLDRNQAAIAEAITQEKPNATANSCEINGLTADVSCSKDVSGVWEKVGPTSLLFNCAGITKDGWLLSMDEKAWDDVMNVNLKGTFLMTQGFAKQWVGTSMSRSSDEQGSIINISSMVGKTGNLGQANYAASKAGVVGFTKTAAKELASKQIRVNAILPGFITTPMTAAVPDKVIAKMLTAIPAERMGDPEDIANVALFLASNRSSYMTGEAIEVAGGLWM